MFDTEKFWRKRIQVAKFNIERRDNTVIISIQGNGILSIQYVEAKVRDWIKIVMHLRKNRRCKFLFNVVWLRFLNISIVHREFIILILFYLNTSLYCIS